MKGSGGFLLLLVGALGLIGFLTGQLDRWLAFLFTPGGTTPVNSVSGAITTGAATPTTTPVAPAPGDRRGQAA